MARPGQAVGAGVVAGLLGRQVARQLTHTDAHRRRMHVYDGCVVGSAEGTQAHEGPHKPAQAAAARCAGAQEPAVTARREPAGAEPANPALAGAELYKEFPRSMGAR